jgi:hypothetical protein
VFHLIGIAVMEAACDPEGGEGGDETREVIVRGVKGGMKGD